MTASQVSLQTLAITPRALYNFASIKHQNPPMRKKGARAKWEEKLATQIRQSLLKASEITPNCLNLLGRIEDLGLDKVLETQYLRFEQVVFVLDVPTNTVKTVVTWNSVRPLHGRHPRRRR